MLTHKGRDKMVNISQAAYLNAFSWRRTFEYRLILHRTLFLGTRNTNTLALVQTIAWWLGADQSTSHCVNQRCVGRGGGGGGGGGYSVGFRMLSTVRRLETLQRAKKEDRKSTFLPDFYKKIGVEIRHFPIFSQKIGVETMHFFQRPEKGGQNGGAYEVTFI